MKRKYFFALGAAVLLLASCGPKRYGCNKRRCIVTTPTEQAATQYSATRNA